MVEAKGQAGEIFGVISEVPADELRRAFDGPAVSINKFYITTTPGGVRVAFMEALGDTVPPVFRTAIFISYPDALALRDLLSNQLGPIEPFIRQQAEVEAASPTARKRNAEP